MKILWATPTHTDSAIGRFSELVTAQLIGKGCEVTVVATETNFMLSRCRSFSGLTISPVTDHLDEDLDRAFDSIIANFGDHYPNHARSLDLLRFARVVGIFHDADMTNFGNGARAEGREIAGPSGHSSAGNTVTGELAKQCAGAVAHADHYRSVVEQCDGPIAVVPLAWSLQPGVGDPFLLGNLGDEVGDRFRVMTVGNINPNKCADRVVQAIGASPKLRDTVEYRLVGAIQPEVHSRLCGLAERSGVRLVVDGPIDDARLHHLMKRADVVACFREPVLEGASASTIEAMLHGRAVLVSDSGFYAGLPSDCVAKVPAATDVSSIRRALERLLDDSAERSNLGRRARAHAEMMFAPERYADDLLRLITEVFVTSAYAPLLGRVANQLENLGIFFDDAATEVVLRTLEGMVPVVRRDESNHTQLKPDSTSGTVQIVEDSR